MTQYIIKRLLALPLILIGVTIMIFAMLQMLSPDQRAALYIRDIPKNANQMNAVIRKYGLNDPIYLQYWHWLVGRVDADTNQVVGGVLRGDFGYSRSFSQPVNDLIKHRFPATIELTLWAILPIIGVGVWLGVKAAVHHDQFIDHAARVFSIIGYSFPTFVLGLLMLMVFYAQLHWFPSGRLSVWAEGVVYSSAFTQYTSIVTIDSLLNGRFDIFWDAIRHLVLPVVTLSYVEWAVFLRITRSSMLEVLGQEYITTARAKGLEERKIINKHAVPNALIPVVTIAGIQIAALLGGVVFTETIFNFPGIGSAAGDAAAQLDVVTVLACAMLTAGILVITNLIVDVTYAFLDPRVRLG
jgi:peptide/nickel transport system permease protein